MNKARDIFRRIKNAIEGPKFKNHICEFETAIEKVISEYDTSDWENRFVIGSVLEILFCALLNSTGFKSLILKERRYDIKVNEVKFSIKSNFIGTGDIG